MKLVLRTTHLFPHSFSFLHRKVSKMTNPCFHFLVSFTFTSKPKFLGTHIKFHQIKLHSVKWINLQAEKTPPQSVTTQGFWRLHTLGKKVSEKSPSWVLALQIKIYGFFFSILVAGTYSAMKNSCGSRQNHLQGYQRKRSRSSSDRFRWTAPHVVLRIDGVKTETHKEMRSRCFPAADWPSIRDLKSRGLP